MAIFNITNNKGTGLTGFIGSSLFGDPCLTPDLSPINVIYYHNGNGILPTIGDTIYYDLNGLNPVVSLGLQLNNLSYILTDSQGLLIPINCI